MKAVVVNEFGGPEVLSLQETPDPVPAADQVVVRLHATGVNPVEIYQRAGSEGYARERPFTPGADGAGVVDAVGRAVVGILPGDRVYVAGSLTGTYADRCVCTADQVHPLPPGLSFEQGAALWVSYGTAFRALFQRGAARPGERVLVHGATGGVGVASVQWGTLHGLDLYATYGSPRGQELLTQLGVEKRFDHGDGAHIARIRYTSGEGIDLIVEMLANVNLESDLELLAPRGRVVIVGSRGSIEITPRKLMRREADVRGLMLAAATAEELREIHSAIAAAGRAGAISPVIQETIPLADAARAHRLLMEAPSNGKIVLVP